MAKEEKQLTLEELQAQLAATQAELEEKNKALEAAKNTGTVAMPIPGVFEMQGEGADGKPTKVKYRFKPGRVRCVIEGGIQVSSAALMRIANGGKPTEQEVEEFPALAGLTKDVAAARIMKLIEISAANIEKVG